MKASVCKQGESTDNRSGVLYMSAWTSAYLFFAYLGTAMSATICGDYWLHQACEAYGLSAEKCVLGQPGYEAQAASAFSGKWALAYGLGQLVTCACLGAWGMRRDDASRFSRPSVAWARRCLVLVPVDATT